MKACQASNLYPDVALSIFIFKYVVLFSKCFYWTWIYCTRCLLVL